MTIQHLRGGVALIGTAAELATANPVLLQRQLSLETDTGVQKIGDGTTHYASLSAVPGGGGAASVVGTAAALATDNPIVALDALAIETDTGVFKVGDGSTHYAGLDVLPGAGTTFRPMVSASSANNGYGVEYNGSPFGLSSSGAVVAFDTGYVGDQGVTTTLPAENDTVALSSAGITVKRTGLFNVWFEVDLDAPVTVPCKVTIPGPFGGISALIPSGVATLQTGLVMFLSADFNNSQQPAMILRCNAADTGINVVYAGLTVNEILTGTQGV